MDMECWDCIYYIRVMTFFFRNAISIPALQFLLICTHISSIYTRHSLRNLPQPPQLQIHVRPPPPQTLHHDAPAKMLRVRPAEREPVAQARETARLAAGARDGVEGVRVAVAEVEQLVVAEGREAVGPDAGEVGGGDAAA